MAILSRGYGGQSHGVTCISDGQQYIYQKPPQVGEEAYWLARNLPGAAVYTGASRYAAGQAAWEQFKPDLFLWMTASSISSCTGTWTSSCWTRPRPSATAICCPGDLARAPNRPWPRPRCSSSPAIRRTATTRTLADLQAAFPTKTVLTATIAPSAARLYPDGRAETTGGLNGQPLLAFAGLARPEVFRRTLQDLGVQL